VQFRQKEEFNLEVLLVPMTDERTINISFLTFHFFSIQTIKSISLIIFQILDGRIIIIMTAVQDSE